MTPDPGTGNIREYRMKSVLGQHGTPLGKRLHAHSIKLIPAAVSIILPTPMVAWMMTTPHCIGKDMFHDDIGILAPLAMADSCNPGQSRSGWRAANG